MESYLADEIRYPFGAYFESHIIAFHFLTYCFVDHSQLIIVHVSIINIIKRVLAFIFSYFEMSCDSGTIRLNVVLILSTNF